MSKLPQYEIDALNELAREIDGGTWRDERGTLWRMGETVPITVTQRNDIAYHLLHDGHESIPVTYKVSCYICEDPEFVQMGMPLCRRCPACGGHVAADDTVCDVCGLDDFAFGQAESEDHVAKCFSTSDWKPKVPTSNQLQAATRAFKDRDSDD